MLPQEDCYENASAVVVAPVLRRHFVLVLVDSAAVAVVVVAAVVPPHGKVDFEMDHLFHSFHQCIVWNHSDWRPHPYFPSPWKWWRLFADGLVVVVVLVL